MPTKSTRLIRSVGYQMVTRLVGLLVGFGSLSVTSRYLGPDVYGQLASASALVGLFTVLTDFGVNSVILRRVNADGHDLNTLVRQSLGLTAMYVLPVALVFTAAGFRLYSAPQYELLRSALAAYAAGLVANCFSSSLRPLYAQQTRLQFPSVVELILACVALGAYSLIVKLHAAPVLILLVQGLIPALGLLLLSAGQRGQALRPLLNYGQAVRLLRAAAPLGVASVVASLYLRVDMLILAGLVSTSALGAYGFAYRIIASINVLSIYIGTTLYPTLAALRGDQAKYREAYTRSMLAILLIALPLGVGAAMTARETILLIGGSEYLSAVPALRVLEITLVPVFINALVGSALALSDRADLFLRMSLVCLLLNIILNVLLVRRFGITGAAVATLSTECMTTVVTGVILRRDVHGAAFLSGGLRIGLATCFMTVTVACLQSRVPLMLTVSAAAVVYGVVSATCGVLPLLQGRRS